MKVNLPDHIPALLNKVPIEDLPEKEADFWRAVSYELSTMLKEAERASNPTISLYDFRKAGNQYIFEFEVNDIGLPKGDSYNWHGQNTSQWLYAGCILLDHGKVSTHH